MMHYARLYADAKGETHLEQVALKLDEADYRPPAPMLFVSHAMQAGALQFVRLPSGWTGENICPPQHQFLICLEGQLELRASDGKRHTFGPGDTVLMEDTSGRGHASHVKGEKDLIAAVVALE
jgi:cupin domain